MTPKLSLTMIVRNEKERLPHILADVAGIPDEIVVVDTGSRDGTTEIAKAWGATVLRRKWVENFAAARNEALAAASGEWMLWLDADDRVCESSRQGLLALKQHLTTRERKCNVVMCPYVMDFTDNEITVAPTTDNGWSICLLRERVVKLGSDASWVGAVHETLELTGARVAEWPTFVVEHHPPAGSARRRCLRNLRILETSYHSGRYRTVDMFYLGQSYLMLGKYSSARTMYEAFCRATAGSAHNTMYYEAIVRVAECAEHMRDAGAAVSALFTAVAYDPRRAEAYWLLGQYFAQRSDWSSALPMFAAAGSLTLPGNGVWIRGAYSWLAWQGAVRCLDELGRRDEAQHYRSLMSDRAHGEPSEARSCARGEGLALA